MFRRNCAMLQHDAPLGEGRTQSPGLVVTLGFLRGQQYRLCAWLRPLPCGRRSVYVPQREAWESAELSYAPAAARRLRVLGATHATPRVL